MRTRKFAMACALVLMTSSTAVQAERQPRLSGLALQQVQSRDFDAGKDTVFSSVLSVLQDSGYRIGSADKDTGLITGTAPSSRRLTWMPFVGFGSSKKNPVVSAFVEARGTGSRVRLNFVMARVTTNSFGGGGDETPIDDPAVYREAFEKINQAIFIRLATDAPATAPTAAPTGVAPVAVPPVTTATSTTPAANGQTAVGSSTPNRR